MDRILDQYDSSSSGSGASKDKQAPMEKRFIPQQADKAAHMLASCMHSGTGSQHKLRKRHGKYK